MRIYDSLQGHLTQLVGRELYTLAQKKKIIIERVIPQKGRQVEWLIKLSVGTQGNTQSIYITDILRVYTWVVSNHWESWATITELDSFISENCVSQKNASYMMAILATFDDIEKKEGRGAAIRFVPKSAGYR
jgi:hypothetical protein